MFTNTGPDNNLDVVISLLAFGVYPNVCYHKEKRKILTTEGRNALIHKSSVNCPFSSQDMKYPSPFFVFGEKVRKGFRKISIANLSCHYLLKCSGNMSFNFQSIVHYHYLAVRVSSVSSCLVFHLQIRTRAISAKGMTLVTPLQLLLFASKKVQSDGQIVLVDDWYGFSDVNYKLYRLHS